MLRLATLLLALALPLAACQRTDNNTATEAHDTSAEAHQASPTEHAHAAAESGAAHEALRLRAIMQRMDGEMAALSHALWLQDYDQVAARAGAIAEHPHIAPEEVQRIQSALGTEMQRFDADDMRVHDASVALRDAAKARDTEGVLRHLSEVQAGCVSCHTQFRERLRTDRP